MSYETIKALHIIGFTCWFAGLFYIVRLFIYNVEARDRADAATEAFITQYNLMQRRLWYGITWPAMVFTLTFGVWLLIKYTALHGEMHTWLHLKTTLLGGLVVYHFILGRIHKQLLRNECRWSSKALRVLNEVATVFLVFIVFLGVLKNTFTLATAGTIGAVLTFVLVAGFWAVAQKRKSSTR